MNMFCHNRFCVYFNDGRCRLDIVELDETGMCGYCLLVKKKKIARIIRAIERIKNYV